MRIDQGHGRDDDRGLSPSPWPSAALSHADYRVARATSGLPVPPLHAEDPVVEREAGPRRHLVGSSPLDLDRVRTRPDGSPALHSTGSSRSPGAVEDEARARTGFASRSRMPERAPTAPDGLLTALGECPAPSNSGGTVRTRPDGPVRVRISPSLLGTPRSTAPPLGRADRLRYNPSSPVIRAPVLSS